MIGQTLSHYRILAKLGEGGMGVVYRALDERLDREVAIKVLPEEFASRPDWLARFEREAKAVAKLSHPNILEIFDFGREGEVTYAVTELLAGETLEERLGGGAVSWRQAAEIGAAISDGLAAAHQVGIVHRDLKPANVFLTSDGRVKILDFGLARYDAVAPESSATEAPTITPPTDPGTVLGTVGYMSPEQVRGDPVDGRSDIFALGCVLYEMVSGNRVFFHDTAVETMNAILNEEPAELASMDVELPSGMESTTRRCLEKKPESRFQSASDLAYNLRSISSTSSPLHARERTRTPARIRPALWLPMAAVVAVLAAVWIWAPWEKTATPMPEVVPNRIAVAPLENRTGDPAHDNLGIMAAESIIQRFAETDAAETVALPPVPDRDSVVSGSSPADFLLEQARQEGAALLLSGACYLDGEALQLLTRLTDPISGEVIYAFEAETVDQRSATSGIEALGEKSVAAVAAHLYPSLDITVMRPPSSYEACQAYCRAEEIWGIDNDDTLLEIQRALELDPEFNMARILVAWASLGNQSIEREQQTREACAAAEKYLDRFTPLERAYYLYLKAYIAGDRVTAMAECRQMVKLAPDLTWVRRELASAALTVNHPREAIEALEPLIATPAVTGYGYATWQFRDMTACYHLLGEFESEIECADLGLEIFPNVGLLFCSKARALAAMGQTEAVEEVINTCCRVQIRGFNAGQIMSDTASELRYHGYPELSADLAARSVAWFEQHFGDSDPGTRTPVDWWSYAHALRVAGRGQEAREALLALKRIGWRLTHVQGALGVVAAQTGDRTEAERIFGQLPESEYPFFEAHRDFWRACIVAHIGEKDRAVSLLEQAFAEGLPTVYSRSYSGRKIYWQLHADVNLEPLWHYPPFEELVKPKG